VPVRGAGGANVYRLLASEGCVQGVGSEAGLLPGDLVDDPKPQPLQREAQAEDDVVGARHPQSAIRFEDAPGRAGPLRATSR
jgi:hypothetical protein